MHTEAVQEAYRVKEAERVFRISKTKLYELMKTGQLPTTKVGGRRLIPRASLVALLNEAA